MALRPILGILSTFHSAGLIAIKRDHVTASVAVKAGEALVERLSGNLDALADYGYRLDAIYNAYLRSRSTYYMLEERWADRQFWRRRRVPFKGEIH